MASLHGWKTQQIWSFNCTNVNFLHTRMLCTKLRWNWTSSSGEEVNLFSLSHYYLHLEKVMTLHFYKLEWPYPRTILQSSFEMFLWNWLSSSGEDVCYIVNVSKSFDVQVPQIRMKYNFENFQITFVTLFNSFNDIQDMALTYSYVFASFGFFAPF